jgi:predicted RNA-binding Zn-ribbon protein involved in translation (DUF1610 family)
MRIDPSTCFPYYFVVWALLGVFSWLWVRSRPTPQEKKKWSDRSSMISGVFVTGFICFILILREQYFAIPFFLAVGIVIVVLNRRNTFYCDACGKYSFTRNPFSSSFHCPHCGHRLR